jgi:hypothetical protein
VKVERLETFLVAEAAAIGELLRAEEQWARQNVPSYPPRPEALAFRSDRASPDELVRRFVAAVRINPQSRLALFVQLPPGQGASGRTTLRESDVTLLKSTESTKFNTFVAVSEGDLVPAIDVVATATDEPDYGLDIGLWEDNDTAHGKAYGFGRQPFGNPKVEFGSQRRCTSASSTSRRSPMRQPRSCAARCPNTGSTSGLRWPRMRCAPGIPTGAGASPVGRCTTSRI